MSLPSHPPGTPANTAASAMGSARIGDYFIQAGRLTQAQVDSIVQKQQADNLRFGDAAMALGLLKEGEVQLALSKQYHYANASTDPMLAGFPIAYAPHTPEAESIRKLRTQILLQLQADRTQSIAIVSPNGGEGKSYVAASLALALAQNNQRTLLINANLRQPQRSGLLDSQRQQGLSSVLSGRQPIEPSLVTPDFPHLAVLDAGPLPPNPAELLLAPGLQNVIQSIGDRFDIIILDTPPTNLFPDAQLIAQQVDACIIVAQKHKTLLSDIRKTKRLLQSAGGKLLGSVYNTYVGTGDSAPSGGLRRWWHALRHR